MLLSWNLKHSYRQKGIHKKRLSYIFAQDKRRMQYFNDDVMYAVSKM